MRADKDREQDDDIVELTPPAVPMPRSNPKTYSEYKMQKIQKKLWNIANPERMNTERRTGSHPEESRPGENGSHSHSNHA